MCQALAAVAGYTLLPTTARPWNGRDRGCRAMDVSTGSALTSTPTATPRHSDAGRPFSPPGGRSGRRARVTGLFPTAGSHRVQDGDPERARGRHRVETGPGELAGQVDDGAAAGTAACRSQLRPPARTPHPTAPTAAGAGAPARPVPAAPPAPATPNRRPPATPVARSEQCGPGRGVRVTAGSRQHGPVTSMPVRRRHQGVDRGPAA
jgi:hypothetical protein